MLDENLIVVLHHQHIACKSHVDKLSGVVRKSSVALVSTKFCQGEPINRLSFQDVLSLIHDRQREFINGSTSD